MVTPTPGRLGMELTAQGESPDVLPEPHPVPPGATVFDNDNSGRRLSAAPATGPTLTYGWDDAHRLTTLDDTATATGLVPDPDGRAVISTAGVLRFFRDDANREESAGTVRRIRIWNGPLSGPQVAAL